MHAELIGYLLNALDDEEVAWVEATILANESTQRQLEILRFALIPLGIDARHAPPPDNLAARTCKLVRESRQTKPPQLD